MYDKEHQYQLWQDWQATGSEKSFTELFSSVERLICSVALNSCKGYHCQADVNDVIQEARIRVWRYLHRWNPEKGALSTWVCRCAQSGASQAMCYIKYGVRRGCANAKNTRREKVAPDDMDYSYKMDNFWVAPQQEEELEFEDTLHKLTNLCNDYDLFIVNGLMEGETCSGIARNIECSYANIFQKRDRLRKRWSNY